MGRRQDLLLIAVQYGFIQDRFIQDRFIQDRFKRLNPSNYPADLQWSAFCCQLASYSSVNEDRIKRQ
jgi:hypothetical protein